MTLQGDQNARWWLANALLASARFAEAAAEFETSGDARRDAASLVNAGVAYQRYPPFSRKYKLDSLQALET